MCWMRAAILRLWAEAAERCIPSECKGERIVLIIPSDALCMFSMYLGLHACGDKSDWFTVMVLNCLLSATFFVIRRFAFLSFFWLCTSVTCGIAVLLHFVGHWHRKRAQESLPSKSDLNNGRMAVVTTISKGVQTHPSHQVQLPVGTS